MRRVVILIFAILIAPVKAEAGGRDALFGILGGVLGEIDRQQAIEAEREQQRAAALIDVCYQGDERACRGALKSPALNAEGRRAIRAQLQAIADQRAADELAYQNYAADWTRCRDDGHVASCDAALRYPQLSDKDHAQLITWRQQVLDREQEAARREAELRAAAAAQAVEISATPQPLIPIATASIETAALPAAKEPAIGPELLFLLAVTSLAVFLMWWKPSTWVSAMPSAPQSSNADMPTPPPAMQNSARHATIFNVSMTGHFPTDVRRVLEG